MKKCKNMRPAKKEKSLLFRSMISSFFMFTAFGFGFASGENKVIFVNKGKIDISGTRGVVYVSNSVRMLGADVSVVLNGDFYVGGNFVQDAENNVFKLADGSSLTSSTGTLHFVDAEGKNTAGVRRITSANETAFDRSGKYIAFPHININTDDTVKLAPKMGIDAKTIQRASKKKGVLYLESSAENDSLYDASLRITDKGVSSSLVAQGAVVVEKDISKFRGSENNLKLFPFASPFTTQKAGYFAGNWVRRPVAAENNHTRYVYGNKPFGQNSNIIHFDQYVSNPMEKLTPGQAYLVKLHPAGFDYNSLKESNGLTITAGSDYNLSKFVFNGNVFSLTPYQEQLFADDALPAYEITSISGTTVNWVIGNSYTSPISIDKLTAAMSGNLTFSDVIYIYSPGSQSYIPKTISGSGISVSNLTEIPAMSVFMLRISKNNTATGTFSITKDMLTHGTSSIGIPKYASPARAARAKGANQINFKLTPENNNFIYDLAAIGLRDDASFGSDGYDIAKVSNAGDNGFQLYTISDTGSKLTVNGLPLSAEKVDLYLTPASEAGSYKLSISNQESLQTEGVYLQDLLTGETIDLNGIADYVFHTSPSDPKKRFVLHFKQAVATSADENGIQSYYSDGKIYFHNLNKTDINSSISIYDIYGKRQDTGGIISEYPYYELPLTLTTGVYIIQINGNRNFTAKFIKR
ncbi:MAG: T9SS type A sorting domain-containing protein [Prevotellaceae bacterium]|nr:T9SS type A sorting domain-containing protein [Prevotellaceae bacterium]